MHIQRHTHCQADDSKYQSEQNPSAEFRRTQKQPPQMGSIKTTLGPETNKGKNRKKI